ncbi:single-stranded-DNA-specific exonuclease RecJ [Pseudogemmatithrix spongiicola]|uniref:Single-stranded-DNA-specific exonuclease RecJ n=1 Tax=Pseudogemmatithrix spongiicola TaxID=3062599 RepID=A0AA49Q8Q2_9BACT|nr:single-stranded-DNA-specific exonuclease RecJ [Gemmatimonadaceae bacterium 'strain 138']WKW15330.1 single-stranded-DNA-specific exonuclease RecJ [Gemmatimonadaceae bacterium 'strain 318']
MSRARPAARWRDVPRADEAAVAALYAELRAGNEQKRIAQERLGRAAPPPIPEAVARLLVLRGVRRIDDARLLLAPSLAQLTPPEALTDLARAAERLVTALRRGERILVHGDYDVDGICSTALLTKMLRAMGGEVEPFIPDRKTDGYDLGAAGVRRAVEVRAKLVLTCDCGTTALGPARELAAQGIDLIVTDHHRPMPELPTAFAVVNPQRESELELRGDRALAAVGVAWKLMAAVLALRGADVSEAERASLGELLEAQLELVALATVADVAALVGDNRIFVAEGLKRMGRTPAAGARDLRNRGLRALIRSAGLDDKRLTAGRLGFVVAPRLNAVGRIRHASIGVDLLLAEDDGRAMDLAAQCNRANDERQALDRGILEQAQRKLEDLDVAAARGIVLHGEGWEPGVIGIVASRIVEITHRPTFMIAVNADGGVRVGKGSGRSVPGFDLHAALTACGDLLEKYGGHRAAAGLTIAADRIEEFAARFDQAAAAALTEDQLHPELRPDLEMRIDDADVTLLEALRFLEPFGMGNPGPVLLSRGVQLKGGARSVGSDGLKLELKSDGGPREAIGWGMAHRAAALGRDARVDMVYRLEMNEFRNARTLQANILDLRPSDG